MSGVLQPMQDFAHEAVCALRAALRRGALVGMALLIATLGAAFLVFAAYIGLRFLLGPGLAALVLGLALLALAAGVLFVARPSGRNIAAPPPTTHPPTTPPRPADAATMAVFTAAFVLGRRLADRLNSSTKS